MFFLSGASNPPSPSGGQAQTTEQRKATTEHTDTYDTHKPSQLFVSVVENKSKHIDGSGTDTHENRKWNSPEWWTAWFTGGLFFATVGLWIVTGFMWRSTSRSVSDGEESIKVSLRSAKAAEESVTNSYNLMIDSRESTERELRAYIGIVLNSDDTSITQTEKQSTLIKVRVKNFGLTPAFKLRVRPNYSFSASIWIRL